MDSYIVHDLALGHFITALGLIFPVITRLRGLIRVLALSGGPESVLDVLVSLFLLDDVKYYLHKTSISRCNSGQNLLFSRHFSQ